MLRSRTYLIIPRGRLARVHRLCFTRSVAARFSFLLSIPAIALASGYQAVKLFQSSEPVDWGTLGSIVFLSALSAYICIGLFLKFLDGTGMAPFAIYRVLLAEAIVLVST